MSKKKIAAIISEYRPGSHADVIVGKYLQGFPTDQGFFEPRVELASMYIDMFPDNDMGRAMAEEFGVPRWDGLSLCTMVGEISVGWQGIGTVAAKIGLEYVRAAAQH